LRSTAPLGEGTWQIGEKKLSETEMQDALRGQCQGGTVYLLPWRLGKILGLTWTDSPLVALSGVLYDEHGRGMWTQYSLEGPLDRQLHCTSWQLLPEEPPEGTEKIKFVRRVHEGNVEPRG